MDMVSFANRLLAGPKDPATEHDAAEEEAQREDADDVDALINNATPAQLSRLLDEVFREEEIGGVVDAMGNVSSDADPGL